MRQCDGFFKFLFGKDRRAPLLAAALTPMLLFAGSALAASTSEPAVRLLKNIPIPVNSTNATGGMYSYDISWVDQSTGSFYLADRSNQAVDVVNPANGKVQFVTATPAFAGANPAGPELSGPNGVLTTSAGCIIATDAATRVVSFTAGGTQVSNIYITAPPGKGAPGRADELAYDPADNLLLVMSPFPNGSTNAARPYASFFTVDSACTLANTANFIVGFATNGIEQPAWDPMTKLFYVSVPQILDATAPGAGTHGLIIAISPKTMKIVKTFRLSFCQPAGLSLNTTTGTLLAGCSVVFDGIGDVWSGTDIHTARPEQQVLDPTTGAVTIVRGVGASDEVWYNAGDDHWYTGSSGSPYSPHVVVSTTPPTPLTAQGANILGVIDGTSMGLDQLVPTFGVPATSTHPSGSGHSVAADATNSEVFVPAPANNALPNCKTGCIQVFHRKG
jgi:hypothetical protein